MGLLTSVGVPMSLAMEGSAGVASFFLFTGMWLVMMLAMMLPSTYPTLQLFRTVYSKRHTFHGGTFLFALSYFLVWTAAGSLFYFAYIGIGWLRQATESSGPI